MTTSRPVSEARPDVLLRDVAALAAVEHDLLVIGGGIYGVTAAYEAARRGLRTALVEADDFGGGASWNSLKTIHGGLRHLQRLDLASHRESVRERCLLLRLAPAVVRPLPFLAPAYGHGAKGREALRLGLLLDDLLAVGRNRGLGPEQRLRASRMMSPAETVARVPGLRTEGLTGGALWEDAQVDSSERLTIAFLRAAAGAGARSANHCEALRLLHTGSRVTGARVRDRETGLEHDIGARMVLNAAGAGAGSLVTPLGGAPLGPMLQAANLVFEGPWPLPARLAVGARSRDRYLFLVPWRDRILAGTEYWPATQHCGADAVGKFRKEVEQTFPWAGLEGRRLVLVHRGLVPGDAGPDSLATGPRFDDHATCGGPAGVLTVRGVKYTTARAIGERAVRRALGEMGLRRSTPPPHELLAWARPLGGSLAERTRCAAREEMALTLTDAVLRRLDLGTAGPPAESDLAEVAGVMAAERGWDEARVAREKAAVARFYEAAYNGNEAGEASR
jgi:glycerol-3-phosphate dehydrogenase